MRIFSAPWVVPVISPVIGKGSIAVDEERIVAVGHRDEVVAAFPKGSELELPGILMPGLVNAHMHLELSWLQDRIEPPAETGFVGWIENLLRQREEMADQARIEASWTAAIARQYRSGVGLIGDIGNVPRGTPVETPASGRPLIRRMIEYLGPTAEASRRVQAGLDGLEDRVAATGHAAYSTSPSLLQHLKQRARTLGHIFSIHTAESRDERRFVQSGLGPFRTLLEKRGSWDGSLDFSSTNFSGTVSYFDHLGLLDDRTLLVHCVDVTPAELQLVKSRGSRICLCPGSNRFLEVGRAPVAEMLAHGLQPALGTDSSASNRATDLWREMSLLMEEHPALEPAAVLAMATSGGAAALGCQADFGSLEPGKKACFLHVASDRLGNSGEGEQLLRELVSGGQPARIEWVSAAGESVQIKEGASR